MAQTQITLSNGKEVDLLLTKNDRDHASLQFGGKYHINTPEEQCGVDGKYWYGNACHITQQPIMINFNVPYDSWAFNGKDYEAIMTNGIVDSGSSSQIIGVNSGTARISFTITRNAQVKIASGGSSAVLNSGITIRSTDAKGYAHSSGGLTNWTLRTYPQTFLPGNYEVVVYGSLSISELRIEEQ